MNNLLLDSHIFLWAVLGDKRLGKAARRLVETTPHVYISALSIFELKAKEAKGKLTLPADLAGAAQDQGFALLDLTAGQLGDYRIFTSQNADPFDNALLSVAEKQHFHFLTSDELIIPLGKTSPWIIDGRE